MEPWQNLLKRRPDIKDPFMTKELSLRLKYLSIAVVVPLDRPRGYVAPLPDVTEIAKGWASYADEICRTILELVCSTTPDFADHIVRLDLRNVLQREWHRWRNRAIHARMSRAIDVEAGGKYSRELRHGVYVAERDAIREMRYQIQKTATIGGDTRPGQNPRATPAQKARSRKKPEFKPSERAILKAVAQNLEGTRLWACVDDEKPTDHPVATKGFKWPGSFVAAYS